MQMHCIAWDIVARTPESRRLRCVRAFYSGMVKPRCIGAAEVGSPGSLPLIRIHILLGIVLALLAGSLAAQQPDGVTRQDGKVVPLRLYEPAGDTCLGIAIISPGAGGSETGYAYLGQALASMRYVTVIVGHPESGLQAVWKQMQGHGLREGLARLITDAQAYEGRFMDIAAARHWAAQRCNRGQSILLGHSMGAATAMIEAGAKNKLGLRAADGFEVYIVLSPQGSGSPPAIFPAGAWQGISKPLLSITGSKDDELGGGSWETRREPFENMAPGCKWFAVIDDATHMNLAGHGLSRRSQALTIQTIQQFLLAVHQGECKLPPPQPGITMLAK